MMRRKCSVVFKTACLLFVVFFVLRGRFHLSNRPGEAASATSNYGESSSSIHHAATQPLRKGNSTLLKLAPASIHAIMYPDDKAFPRLECPAPSRDRYQYLAHRSSPAERTRDRVHYFFALDLHQSASLLPTLIGSIVEAMRILGPKNCALSIVEGRSDDGTFEILKLLRPEIEEMGATYFFTSTDIDPKSPTNDRVQALADIRNQALEPLIKDPDEYSVKATVIFLNDVAICSQDILELVHQRMYHKADMTCAMDWTYVGEHPTFYDVWIARGMTGDTFFSIPEDGNWNSAWNLFWNDAKAKDRLDNHRPFQVFACWNGATAFTAKPILEKAIKFRAPVDNECYEGEPKLFCKDMWHHGFGKIAVIPSVNIEYSVDAAQRIKALKGFASDLVKTENENEVRIGWEPNPPATVKCMPNYWDQSWRPWDEAL